MTEIVHPFFSKSISAPRLLHQVTGSVVVHLMTEEQRTAVALEDLWTEGEPHRLRVLEPGRSMPLTLDTITAE